MPLPDGFVLDQAPQAQGGLPQGFVLDPPSGIQSLNPTEKEPFGMGFAKAVNPYLEGATRVMGPRGIFNFLNEQAVEGLKRIGVYGPNRQAFQFNPLISQDTATKTAQKVVPLLDPTMTSVTGWNPGVVQGVAQFLGGMGSSLTTPDVALPLSAAKTFPQAIGKGFQVQMASQVPQGIAGTYQAIRQGDVPTAVEEGLNAVLGVAAPVGIQRHLNEVKPPTFTDANFPVQPKIGDMDLIEGKVPPKRQIERNASPTETRFVANAQGQQVDLSQLSPKEQIELLRGPRQYIDPRAQVRPAQQAPTIVGQRPIDFGNQIIDPNLGQPSALPLELSGEATRLVERPQGGEAIGGKVSFAGQGIPSAGQAKVFPKGEPNEQAALMQNTFVPSAEKATQPVPPLATLADVFPKEAPATFLGVQQGFGDRPAMELYNLTEAIPGHGKGSTVSRNTLEQAGYSVPQRSSGKGIGGGMQAAVEKNKSAGAARLPGGEMDPNELAKLQEAGKAVKDELPLAVAAIRDKEKKLRGDFVLSTPRMLVSPKESGFTKIDHPVDVEQLINRTKNKQASESKALDSLGVFDKVREAAKDGKITPEQAAKVIQEHGPRVEVHTYGMEGKVSKVKAAFDKMTHEWYDVASPREKVAADKAYSDLYHSNLSEEETLDHLAYLGEDKAKKAVEYAKLKIRANEEPQSVGPRATSAYSHVSPKDVKKFPLQRVDVTVPLGKNVSQAVKGYMSRGNIMGQNEARAEGVLWPPDSIHEQLPNTLGWTAYQDIPHEKYGEVRNAVEVQSGWGQSRRNARMEIGQDEQGWFVKDKNGTKERFANEKEANAFNEKVTTAHGGPDNPLLHDYNRLILKAFIEQARKDGKRYVSIPDAETAMMSEGHDTQLTRDDVAIAALNRRRASGELTANEYHDELSKLQPIQSLPQEKGMRLNYDTILPKIMEELTGQKGERVELGEHKNAFENVPQEGQHGGVTGYTKGKPRENLIFRNLDGTPKTSVTGLVYDISKLSDEKLGKMSLFEKDRPENRSGRLYVNPIHEILRAIPSDLKMMADESKKAAKIVEDWMARQELINTKDLADKIFAAGQSRKLEELPSYRAQPGEKTPLTEQGLNGLKQVFNTVSEADKVISPIDVLVDYLDKGAGKFDKPLMNEVRKPLDDAFNAELNLKDMVLDPVIALKKSGKLSKQNGERIGVYMDSLQQNGRQRLIDSGVRPEIIDKIVKGLSSQEKGVADLMHKMYDATYPMVEATAKKLGIELEKVQNYSPWHRDYQQFRPEPDKLSGPKASERATEDVVSWLEQNYPVKGTKTAQGYTIARQPGAKTAIKTDAFDVFDRHMRDVAHFVTSQAPLNQIAKVVRDERFAKKYGKLGQDLMIDWLNNYARQGRRGSDYPRISAVMDSLRKRLAVGVLGFRVASQVIHTTNIPLAMQRTGIEWWKRGLEAAINNPSFVQQHFAETFERGGSEPGLLEATRGPITEAAFLPQRFIDKWNAQATVMGVYLRRLGEQGKNWQDYEKVPIDQKAIQEARVLSRRAVASPLYKDMPLALTKGSVAKLFFQFQNTFLDQWSNIRYDLPEAIRTMEGKKAAGLVAAIAAMLVIESGIKLGTKKTGQAITGYNPKQDDNEVSKKLLEETLKRVPGSSQLLSATMRGDTGVPVVDAIREAGGSAKQFLTAENPKEKKLAGVKAVTSALELAGVPGTSQASELVQNKMKAEMFKTHRTALEEYAKKNKLNLTNFDQRVQAEEGLKASQPSKTEEEKVAGMKGYETKMLARRKELVKKIDSNDQNWMKSRGIEVPGWGDFVNDGKQRVVFTDEENKKLEELVLKEYKSVISDLRKDRAFASMQVDQSDKEYANREFHKASKRARQDLEDLIRAKKVK